MKKLLSLLTVMALIVCAWPITASANTAVGEFTDKDICAKAKDWSIYEDPEASAEFVAKLLTAFANQIDTNARNRYGFYREAYIGLRGKDGYLVSILNKDDSMYLFIIEPKAISYMLRPHMDVTMSPTGELNYLTYYYTSDYQGVNLTFLRRFAGPLLGLNLPEPVEKLASLEEPPDPTPTPTPKPKVQIRKK